jgi:hypothetical protein
MEDNGWIDLQTFEINIVANRARSFVCAANF